MSVSETSCLLKDYDYRLPEELVAQRPAPERGGSRLMLVDRGSGEITAHRFSEIPALLKPDDCVVLNDTKVIPARLRARKILGEPDTGTGAQVEVVLLRERDDGAWEALVKRGRRVKAGAKLAFGTRWHATVEEVAPSGARVLRFENDSAWKVIEALGEVPLPPYIERDEPDELDRKRYQTVYAKVPGAVAAPTAGLHFTQEMLDAVSAQGISVAYVTLHVSYGTFRPIAAEDISQHQVEAEYFKMSAESVKTIDSAKASGGRIVAVGTTTCRVLETCARGGSMEPSEGRTDLYIRPPFEFRAVDALLTNFHLPRSSLFVLVCAFAGRELMLKAYERAISEKFSFYSYGDAMLIL
jgi:S-adenosylmethionine:tRNA ribosyltransferase-isomerase